MTAQKKILVVEDYVQLHHLYQQMMGYHHCYDFAISLEEAVELLEMDEYDYVLCDYHLSDKTNGRQVYDWIADNRPGLLEESFVFVCAAMDKVADLGIKIIEKGDFRAMKRLVNS